MMPPRISRLLATFAAAMSLSACSYDCGENGSTVANGVIRDAAGVTLATVQASVADHLHPSFLRLSVGVMGSANSAGVPLKGHVLRAQLVSASGEVLGNIPTD